MSRRSREGTPAKSLTIRVYEEDRAEWERLAEADALSLSTWLSKVANAEVARRQGKRSK